MAHILFFYDIADGAVDKGEDQLAFIGLGVQGFRMVPIESLHGGVVGEPGQRRQRKRLGRILMYTGHPKMGRWRNRRAASCPNDSVNI